MKLVMILVNTNYLLVSYTAIAAKAIVTKLLVYSRTYQTINRSLSLFTLSFFIFSFKCIYKFLGLSNVLVVGPCFFKLLYSGISVEWSPTFFVFNFPFGYF